MTVIETLRLRLEPLCPVHAEALYAIYTEPAVRRFLITRPNSPADFDRIFDQALQFAESHGMWAVTRNPTREIIGRVGFFAFGPSARPELVFLLSEASWGHGFATEAASAALRWAFLRRDWSEAIALVRPGNLAAMRVLAKLGMLREQAVVVGGLEAFLYQVNRDPFAGRAA
jgi:ribosomal-protein-alanine N-acetyltransferase